MADGPAAIQEASIERPGWDCEQWLRNFAACVRRRDLEAGRALCDPDILSFGTVCWRSENLDALVREQWEQVWSATEDFDFDYETTRAVVSEGVAALLTTWTSIGFAADGARFPRRGRATIVLHRTDDTWRAVHTHFSMDPRA